MFLVKLALRNLTRHKRRTLITSSVIALGLMLYLVFDSLLIGMAEVSFDNVKDLEYSHLQITTEDYWENRDELPLEDLITVDQELLSMITTLSDLQGIAPRIKFQANLHNGVNELPITVVGIDPINERQVFTTEDYLVQGQMIERDTPQALMGKKLADLMEFFIGDYLTLVFKSEDGAFNTIEAEIVGLMNTSDPIVNDLVYIPLELAQWGLNIDNQVSEIDIRLSKDSAISLGKKELETAFAQKWPGLTVNTWREAAAAVVAMSQAQNIKNQFIIFIILILAAVGIVNTIILSALERLKETGMMKAMGMKEWEIIVAFMLESIGMGVFGGIVGCIFGALGVWLLTVYGVDLAWFGMGEMNIGFPMTGLIYGKWNLSAFSFVFFFGTLIALISSILPARWAARKNPIDAIYKR